MFSPRELLLLWFLVLVVGGTEHVFRPGRRVCAVGTPRGPESESFVQRVYQPFLTTCDGHRACSTYRTIYRTAYRRSPGPAVPRPRYACCPGWKRTSGLPRACGAAICRPPCQNGGTCVQPGRCHCPAGWQGDTCQTDVDECRAGQGTCPQYCVNTAGSYWCQCREGHGQSADGVLCLPKTGAPRVAPNPTTGLCRHTLRGREASAWGPEASLGCGPGSPACLTQGWVLPRRGQRRRGGSAETPVTGGHPGAEAAARACPTAQPGLEGPGAWAPRPQQPPGSLLPAAGPHRLSERADLLPGGAAGVLFLQGGAVTGGPRPWLWLLRASPTVLGQAGGAFRAKAGWEEGSSV
ncbi:epidermal growth factor-like protein 7 isoform X1 [Lutra lutra]|uniref:epidermal growth factor-like protein 7 isoform X1 n=1 Tax=Lutra lutra TaxID=9657 RepID=UPI001FD4B77B|nr:epidermal growth factor-like protein 7 isoform X1 [Lutra lutra]XP_047554786.1 epidermal growth factor-like protein 7 isoform X1 [Lutra lutra]XP_047554787.1 epidermal growth factor-like protein 7 isoform X1 [Lutra lutra]XP_047554788.1 epidermal growth factor-like protein 7 isoform X1 [Lutra lutra]XP_047554789.1 epidermal growth factor-like protein 7 isoform X1 [Lutra lutra]XP_047554790.1 epidermal growth factor-like protein 7 isoform X1 [Lutra lutra]